MTTDDYTHVLDEMKMLTTYITEGIMVEILNQDPELIPERP